VKRTEKIFVTAPAFLLNSTRSKSGPGYRCPHALSTSHPGRLFFAQLWQLLGAGRGASTLQSSFQPLASSSSSLLPQASPACHPLLRRLLPPPHRLRRNYFRVLGGGDVDTGSGRRGGCGYARMRRGRYVDVNKPLIGVSSRTSHSEPTTDPYDPIICQLISQSISQSMTYNNYLSTVVGLCIIFVFWVIIGLGELALLHGLSFRSRGVISL